MHPKFMRMLGIKKLDTFIFKSFALLFAGTFFICLFIFMMQFLWRYVDDLVGKGLEMTLLAQFFFYSALTLVPLSLPLAILLASLITFGNFGERYELLAMKAAGVSLFRIMRPLIVFSVFLACVSFYFQNVIAPKAQTKLWTLLVSMRQKSPEVDIPEGVFYDEIPDYNLYVKSKDRETGMLYGLMIYNFSDGFDNAHVIVADSGSLEMTADKEHLYLHLYSGEQFENLKAQTASAQNVPYRRETFREKHSIIAFDANFNMVDAGFMSDQSISKDMLQLRASIDSMTVAGDSVGRSYFKGTQANYERKLTQADSLKLATHPALRVNVDSLFAAQTLLKKKDILKAALRQAENTGNDWEYKSFSLTENDKRIRKHWTEWHKKITVSLACVIFFFIGAPLGAIIKKGGLGMPVVVSVLIFIIYYIIDNTGYKMARDGNWEIWQGMWISTFVLMPVGAFITYKSNKDSVVFNADTYIEWLKRLVGIRATRHIVKKEVIIEDIDYRHVEQALQALSAACQAYLRAHKLSGMPNYVRLWQKSGHDGEVASISDALERLVETLSNSTDAMVLNQLNAYPILSATAHQSPFRAGWLNALAGIFLPLGGILYVRIWIFRLRLEKDLQQVVKTSGELLDKIKTINN